MTFLLRNPEVFANDDVIQNYVKQGRAILVKGDATVKEDIKTGWETALQHGNGSVDLTLFSVGKISLLPTSRHPLTYNALKVDTRSSIY